MITLTPDISFQIREKILLSRNIVIIPHRNVDGDGLGGALAMQLAVGQLNKQAIVAVADPELPPGLDFLPNYDKVIHDFDPENYDLVIFVDHSEFRRTGYTEQYPEWEKKVKRLIVIDHHETVKTVQPTADSIIFSDPQSSAVAMILLQMFKTWEIQITPEIATCLLLGVYTDTNSFKNENSNSAAVTTASELMELGGNLTQISRDFFQKRGAGTLQLWGRAMSRLKVSRVGAAVTAVYKQDFYETNTTPDALGGLINDMVRSVKNARMAILLVEKDDGIKISLRGTSFSDFDVSRVAALYGGGGHKQAAGFFIKGQLNEELAWKITEVLELKEK